MSEEMAKISWRIHYANETELLGTLLKTDFRPVQTFVLM